MTKQLHHEEAMRKGSKGLIDALWREHPRIMALLTEKNGTGRVPVGGFPEVKEPKEKDDG